MSENPKALYQQVIMQHNREPVAYEKRPEASIVIEAYNPLCGDQFKLYLEMGEGRVREVHFHGYGCAISKASASILVKKIRGKTVEEVRELIERFSRIVRPEGGAIPENEDEEMAAFATAREFPARLQCAVLAWEALEKYLRKLES